jgi:translation initiation factor IF-3
VHIQQFIRVNQKIRAREVRTIDMDGKPLGVLPIGKALALAQEKGLDLVEVAPNATPPVCRIVDYGKFKYEQTKREREAHKHQQANKLKEIKLRLNIDAHDYQTKLKHMMEFLQKGMKVKVSVFFRGRENAHPEYGAKLLQRVIEDVQGTGRPEMMPRQQGRSLQMMLGPSRGTVRPGNQPQTEQKAV